MTYQELTPGEQDVLRQLNFLQRTWLWQISAGMWQHSARLAVGGRYDSHVGPRYSSENPRLQDLRSWKKTQPCQVKLRAAREIIFFEKDHVINRLEWCCIDQLNRQDLSGLETVGKLQLS